VAVKNRVKAHRVLHDMTQEQLGSKLGVSRQTVIAIESGRYLPSLGLAFRLAALFGVRIEDLFIQEEEDW
jgi:putative transcriptional regulator